jgi:hypothetical protein
MPLRASVRLVIRKAAQDVTSLQGVLPTAAANDQRCRLAHGAYIVNPQFEEAV